MITYWILERFIILLRINFIYNFIMCFCNKHICFKKKDKTNSNKKTMSDFIGYGQLVEIEDIN